MFILIALYFLVGLSLAALCNHGSNLLGRFITILIWPYIAAVDGTPRIRWLTHLSGQEVVIEEGDECVGGRLVTTQTVRQRDGYEYCRVKGGGDGR